MTAASDRQLANWLRFTVSSGWGFPGEAARIPFERIASTSVSWEENLRRVEEYDPNLRSLRLQSHFGGLPGEIRDFIDFLAETDTRVSFEENVRDVVARHHLGPEWLEMGPGRSSPWRRYMRRWREGLIWRRWWTSWGR